jgi:hypothetical protein
VVMVVVLQVVLKRAAWRSAHPELHLDVRTSLRSIMKLSTGGSHLKSLLLKRQKSGGS